MIMDLLRKNLKYLNSYENIITIIDKLLKHIDSGVASVLDKALSLKDISDEEALTLFECEGLELWLTVLCADYLRWLSVGDVVTFVINRNINYTNYCIIGCRFCAFSKCIERESYTLSISEILRKVEEAWRKGATEVCIQGGINPKLPPEYYINIVKEIKRRYPHIHIHAYSPQEIHHIAEIMNMDYREVLEMLKEYGLDSIPGTAAEILDDEIRKIICPNKINTKTWVEIIRTAHSLGIKSTATIMYGHVEKNVHRVRHLRIIKDIQRETKGFTEFIPLPFIHHKTRLYLEGRARPSSSGIEDVKMHAIARIYLNNYIKNIQVSWVKLGVKFAQTLLYAGCNDVGGTLMEENISRAAGSTYGTSLSVDEMVRIIRSINRIPAQRDTLYRILKIYV